MIHLFLDVYMCKLDYEYIFLYFLHMNEKITVMGHSLLYTWSFAEIIMLEFIFHCN